MRQMLIMPLLAVYPVHCNVLLSCKRLLTTRNSMHNLQQAGMFASKRVLHILALHSQVLCML